MRVLLISHTCQSRTEGQPKAEWLGRRPGLELCVLTPDRWQHYGKPRLADPTPGASYRMEVGKVRWPWVPGAQFYLHYYPALERLLQTFRPDVIDLWEEPWALVSAHTSRLRNRVCPHVPIISETEQNIFKKLPPPFESFRAYVLRQAALLVGRSHEAVEAARRKGYCGPAEVVPNGVDPALFRPLDREACRREVLPEAFRGDFVAGYVGRLVPEKGLADLVDALPQAGPGVRLLLVGDGPMRDELTARAAALGLSDRVCVLPARPLETLPSVMNALDVLVLPSRTTARWKEQFGRVLIEAHCCGTPVIGSDSGAIPDVVGEGGLVVPEQNPAALGAALRRLADGPAMSRAMGEAGRRAALENCTWEQVAGRMAALYERVLQPAREAVLTA